MNNSNITWVLKSNNGGYVTYLDDKANKSYFLLKDDAVNQLNIYNVGHERNTSNYDTISYNCGGYAFDTYVWLVPYDCYEDLEVEDVILELGLSNCDCDIYQHWDGYDYTNKYVIQLMIKRILDNFKDVRIIRDLSELCTDEYGIIMRTAVQDFHFVKYDSKTDIFSHKMGCAKPENLTIKEVFSPAWAEEYDSDMVIFAKKYNVD